MNLLNKKLLSGRKKRRPKFSTKSISVSRPISVETPMWQSFQDFIGPRAFEDDGGWSYEVWTAAWNSATNHIAQRFQSLPYDELGQEFVNFVLTTKE
jgi:hypothetical protein